MIQEWMYIRWMHTVFKLGCDVNLRLIQEEELPNICIGSLMTS